MSVNLLDLAKGYLTDAVVDNAASFLGTNAESAQSGLAHALPALLGGLMGKAETSSGATDLLGLVTKPELGGGLLDNIGDLFGGGNSTLTSLGGSLLSAVLGDKLGGITDLIGNATGLNSGATSGLLKMAMPLLMGVVGKQVGSSGLSGLMGLLGGQKEHLEKAAPAGFMDKMSSSLGLGALGSVVGNVGNIASDLTGSASNAAKAVTGSVGSAASGLSDSASNAAKAVTGSVGNAAGALGGGGEEGGNKKWPILLLLGALALGYYAYTTFTGQETVETPVVDDVEVEKVVDEVTTPTNPLIGTSIEGFEYLGEYTTKTLADGVELVVPSKGFESHLVDFLESDKPAKSDWFDMRRVLFNTGSADLDVTSMNQIDYVASILNTYPNVHLKFGGYTDNTGNANSNKTLSASRATSVMNALVSKGISAERLSAEGYGIENPVASNDTAEGRQLNRRVSGRVVKK